MYYNAMTRDFNIQNRIKWVPYKNRENMKIYAGMNMRILKPIIKHIYIYIYLSISINIYIYIYIYIYIFICMYIYKCIYISHSVKVWNFYPFPNPSLFITFFDNITPNETRDKYKSKTLRKSYFFMFRRLQNNITCLFANKHFYKQHQAEIWLEIITISGIKMS